jgi:hypothetical protein
MLVIELLGRTLEDRASLLKQDLAKRGASCQGTVSRAGPCLTLRVLVAASLNKLVNLVIGMALGSNAQPVVHELPRHLASSKGNGDLIAWGTCWDDRTIMVDVLGGCRRLADVLVVNMTCRARALTIRNDQMSRPSVKHHVEGLWLRSTNCNPPKIRTFEGDRVGVVAPDWNSMLVQGNYISAPGSNISSVTAFTISNSRL